MQRLSRLLLIAGTIAAVVGLSKVHAAWVAESEYDYTGTFRFTWSLAYTGLLLVAAYGVGLPDLARDGRAMAAWSVAAPVAAAVAISVVQLATGDALLPRFVVFGSALVLVPWYVLCAAAASRGRALAERRDRVVAVGSSDEVAALDGELQREPERHAQLMAHLTPSEARSSGSRHRPLLELAVAERASVIVLDVAAQAEESIVTQAAQLHEAGVRIRTLSLFYEEWLGKLPLSELERVSLMFDIGEIHRARYGRLKRLVDLSFAALGCAALIPLVPVVAAGNALANRGPIFYTQERVGRGGERFRIIKFRTMRPAGGDLANEWTTEQDPRITPFGRILRRTHLDELPQVLNIVRGSLSFVGPRPEQPQYVVELREKIPFYDIRHLVRPGLTGWAQVKFGYGRSDADALEKLQFEFFYLRHQKLSLDLRILSRTLRTVFRGVE